VRAALPHAPQLGILRCLFASKATYVILSFHHTILISITILSDFTLLYRLYAEYARIYLQLQPVAALPISMAYIARGHWWYCILATALFSVINLAADG
jgi:hypothetical protein